MAELVIKLEDQLKCLICLNIYTDPKFLRCNHVFCRGCLVSLAGKSPLGLPCPTCRQVTPIPPAGVASLQPAFQFSHFLDILHEHKKSKQDMLYCPQHCNRELELYCETCKELICVQCTIRQHHGHDYNLISEVFEKHKIEIMSCLNPAEQQLTLASEALEMLNARHGEITNQQATLQAQIVKSSQQLHEAINLREKELTTKLNYITQRKLSELELQREQVETTQAELSSCLNMVKENLRTGSQGIILRMTTTLVVQINEQIKNSNQSGSIKPDTEADMIFSSSDAAAEACYAHGLVSARTFLDPLECYVLSEATNVTTVKEKSAISFQVNTHEEKPFKKLTQSLVCELVSELTGIKTRGCVERREQNQYRVIYQASIKGRHQLHIKVMGEHIRGSPYSVVAKSPIDKLSTPILTISGINCPRGVVVNGMMVIVLSKHYVSTFSPNGDKIQSFIAGQNLCGVKVDN